MTDAASRLLTTATLERFSSKTRDKLLEASLVLFNERGFGAVTTASIAEKSGVLEGSLWYHFRTKKDILLAHIELLEQVFEEFDVCLLYTSPSPRDRLLSRMPSSA